jgi:acyl-CoA thioesterase
MLARRYMETAFDRDTAVQRLPLGKAGGHPREDGPSGYSGAGGEEPDTATAPATATFSAEVSPDWRAGRGPHGGYLAAMLLRALTETVADPARAPRSLTIHYPRAPEPGPVEIHTVVERAGRSLSTLSARMEQDGRLMALALAAFSVPWSAPEIAELPMPAVAPPDPAWEPSRRLHPATPRFLRHMSIQSRIGAMPFTGSDAPMEIGAWLGFAEPRPLDALALALFSDALFSPPFIRLPEPAVTPTIDLTIHFRRQIGQAWGQAGDPRADDPRPGDPDPEELCFARFSSTVVHDGFFEEDGVIWSADGAVLAQSRQLAIVLPFRP